MVEKRHRHAAVCITLLLAVLAGTGQALAQDQAPVDTLLQGLDAAQADTTRLHRLWKRAQEKARLHPKQALQYAQGALRLARRLGAEAKVAESLRLVGRVHHMQGRFAQALTSYRRARDRAEAAGDAQGMAKVLVSMGRLYFVQGNYPKALRYHLGALEHFEQGGTRKLRAICLNNLGLIHERQDNLEEALTYYDRAAQLHREIGNRQGVAQVLHNVGLVLMGRHDYDRALERLRSSLALFEKLDDHGGAARVNNDIGVVLNKQGRPNEALLHLKRAARLSKQQGERRPLAYIYDEMGRAHRSLNRLDDALAYLKQGLALAEEYGAPRVREAASRTLAELYAERGNYVKAYAYHQQYSAVKDSVFNTEKAEIVSQMQTRYEMKKKAHKIESLEQEKQVQALQARQQRTLRNVLLGVVVVAILVAGLFYNRYRIKKKANRLLEGQKKEIQEKTELLQEKQSILRESLKEKELLVKEIHHRVKNNLQVITSLLNTQQRTIGNQTAQAAVQEAHQRVHSMALIHQGLYRKENLAHLDVQEYIETLSTHLLRAVDESDRVVHCSVRAEGIHLSADTAVPLGLIVNELISNSLKHAFPGGRSGRIRVDLKEDGEAYVLEVADDGVGLPPTFRTDQATMGMTLVENMVRQLGGTLQIKNGVGVTYRMRFKGVEEA